MFSHGAASLKAFSFCFSCSKNPAGANGLARILEVLAYSPCIEELVLTDISGYSSSSSHLQTSLGKLFQLTVTLKTVIALLKILLLLYLLIMVIALLINYGYCPFY